VKIHVEKELKEEIKGNCFDDDDDDNCTCC